MTDLDFRQGGPPPTNGPGTTNLADILERVLDKGIVIAGDIKIDLLDIDEVERRGGEERTGQATHGGSGGSGERGGGGQRTTPVTPVTGLRANYRGVVRSPRLTPRWWAPRRR